MFLYSAASGWRVNHSHCAHRTGRHWGHDAGANRFLTRQRTGGRVWAPRSASASAFRLRMQQGGERHTPRASPHHQRTPSWNASGARRDERLGTRVKRVLRAALLGVAGVYAALWAGVARAGFGNDYRAWAATANTRRPNEAQRVVSNRAAYTNSALEAQERRKMAARVTVGVALGGIYLYLSRKCKRDDEEEQKRIRAEVERLEKWKTEFVDAKQGSTVSDEELMAALRERLQRKVDRQEGHRSDSEEDDKDLEGVDYEIQEIAETGPFSIGGDGNDAEDEDDEDEDDDEDERRHSTRRGDAPGGTAMVDRPDGKDDDGDDDDDQRGGAAEGTDPDIDIQRAMLNKLFNMDTGSGEQDGGGSGGKGGQKPKNT